MNKNRPGNPNLDSVRNSDVTKANIKRVANADKFALYVLTEIMNLGLYDFIDDPVKMINELNNYGIQTRRGGKWSRTQYDRLCKRIKQIENSDKPMTYTP